MVSIARRNPKHTKDENKTFARRTRNETSVRRNGKRVTHVKAQIQPYPVESVEIVEWLL